MKLAELFDIDGHVALVTGAASGLGLAFTEAMAENGATVVMTDMNPETLEAEVSRLKAAGCKVEGVVLDVTDTEALKAAIDGTVERHGRLDALFANAGIGAGPGAYLTPDGAIDQFNVQAYLRCIEVNQTAALMSMRFAATHMKRQKSGSIIVTASIAAIQAEPVCGYAYIASKAAMANVARQAAVELAPYNVRVNAIAPGPFRTNIADGRLKKQPEAVKMFADLAPMGRIGETDEIKGLALLLASPAGSYMTGTVIPIDGGATCVSTRGNYSDVVLPEGVNA
jgi:NAD(P)-dependent dehydrogenase (short-subunit alcohol dehydrogenase family)